jgi:hypothetical protein
MNEYETKASNKKHENGNLIKDNSKNILIYEDKNKNFKENNALVPNEENDINPINKDINMVEKNLHKFFNEDLIKALNNDFIASEEKNDSSDFINNNGYNSGSSELSSKENSLQSNNKYIKDLKNVNNTNLERSLNSFNLDKIPNNLYVNIDNVNNKVNNENNNNINININKIIKEENINNEDIKNKIKILNDPLFAPIMIDNQIEEIKEKEYKKREKIIKNIENKINNSLIKNKYDDDVEPVIMVSIINNQEEKTKFPPEVRIGDWICLYCKNLNFSFRIKCNRCGLLRKSSSNLLKRKIYYNKYNNLENHNNTNNNFSSF